MSESSAEKNIYHRPNRRRKVVFIILAVVVVLALALGLGLGLGLRDDGSSDSTSPSTPTTTSTPTATSASTPTPTSSTGPSTNGTLWQPTSGTTWQIQILAALSNSSFDVQVYDIDLFLNDATTISKLHSQGRKVICYFSAGSYENFRPDSASFQASDYGKPLDGWPGEWWLNTASTNVRNIMLKRLDIAKSIGCDGVDPDNVDGFNNDTGFNLTEQASIDFLNFLADAAHSRTMAIGLKNGGDIVSQVISKMEWEINEQCLQYNECDKFQPFIAANKPVFHIEYPTGAPSVSTTTKNSICNDPSARGFSTLLKELSLTDWVGTCI